MPKQTDSQMFIGRLAKQTGLSIQAIRYYESQGLMESARSPTKYRYYNEDHVRRLQFIQRSQNLGFTLREVAEILKILDSEPDSCDAIRKMAHSKLVDLEARIAGLRQLQATLEEVTSRCAGGEVLSTCALISYIVEGAFPAGEK